MLGAGGRYYWGRKEMGREGVVVVFAWMLSQDKHVRSYVDLYSSLGWNSLVCHSQLLNLFFPDKAETLAFDILKQLVEELKVRPCPLVFAAFSSGPKACMYKVFQILQGKSEMKLNVDDCRLIRGCIVGHIYDSSPADFVREVGSRFFLHPSVLNMSHPPKFLSWIANGICSGLDAIFLTRFEFQQAEFWQTLYASVTFGAPYLILCSESDDLAPYQVICNFACKLQDLGGDVKLVTLNGSPHVGHYRVYPVEYKAVVTELLGKAATVYSRRIQNLGGEKMGLEGSHDEISEPILELRDAAADLNQSFRGFSIAPIDHFVVPSSVSYYEGRGVGGSMEDERKESLIPLRSPPTTDPHGVLGQMLFDVCMPKNVENWDVKSSTSSGKGGPYTSSSRRHTPFNPIRCIRCSRL